MAATDAGPDLRAPHPVGLSLGRAGIPAAGARCEGARGRGSRGSREGLPRRRRRLPGSLREAGTRSRPGVLGPNPAPHRRGPPPLRGHRCGLGVEECQRLDRRRPGGCDQAQTIRRCREAEERARLGSESDWLNIGYSSSPGRVGRPDRSTATRRVARARQPHLESAWSRRCPGRLRLSDGRLPATEEPIPVPPVARSPP